MDLKYFKKTRQRELILEVLNQPEKAITAEEVYEAVREQYPKISLSTIYRNLDMLYEYGAVARYRVTDGRWHYQLKQQTGHYHQIFCTGCSKAISIDKCPMTEQMQKMIEKADFQVTGHRFEVYGLCKECQEKGK